MIKNMIKNYEITAEIYKQPINFKNSQKKITFSL